MADLLVLGRLVLKNSKKNSKSFASFTNRTFHLRKPPGFRMVFDATERNEGRFCRI